MNGEKRSSTDQSVRRRRSRALWLGAGLWLAYLAFLPPGMYSIDANSMLAVSESVVSQHTITVREGLGVPGRDGRIYSTWYPLLSLLALPFAYVALIASKISGLPFHYLAAVFASLLPGMLTAATATLVALLAMRLGSAWRGAWMAALCFALGTIALVYARTFFADPLLAFLTIFALYLALGGTTREILGAAGLTALAVLAKPTGVVVGPVLSAYLILKRAPARLSLLPGAATVAGFALYTVYNDVRFGSPLNFGPAWSLFRLGAIPSGVAGLLASPGWGMIWYSPVVLLAVVGAWKIWQERWREVLAIAGIFFAFLLLHSYFVVWYAGWSWGPRYLLPGIAGLCALLGKLAGRWKIAAICLSLAGFVVNAPTLFTFYERYYAELSDRGVNVYPTVAWSVPLAPFVEGWPAALRQVDDAQKADVREIFEQRGAPSHSVEGSRALRVVALWWWVLPLAHIPRAAGAAASIVILLAGCWMIAAARREPADELNL